MDINVNYTRSSDSAGIPEYATDGAAGADIRADLDASVTLDPGKRALIPTGLCVAIPEGYAGIVCARSGLAIKHGIALSNGVGVIDSDYTGELRVGLINLSDTPYTIENGERIAQLIIIKVERAHFLQVKSLARTERGDGGFGSTGRR